MIALTKRQRDLILFLLDKETYVTYDKCASYFGVSNRSIRNDFVVIELFLREKNCLLIKKSGVGLKINCSNSLKSNLRQTLHISTEHYLNKDERLNMILLMLMVQDINTFQQLADHCRVSKQTIINCFEDVQRLLANDGIFIEKMHGVGLKLKGDELIIRRKFIEIVNNHLQCSQYVFNNVGYSEYIAKATIIIKEFKDQCGISYVNEQRIIIILAFILYRIDENLLLTKENYLYLKNIETVNDVLKKYIKYENERNYLATILLGEKIDQIMFDENLSQEDDAFKIAMFLIDSLKELNLDKINQPEMIRGLTIHLRSAIYRYHNHFQIKNDMLDEIKVSISLIYEFTRKQLNKIEKEYNVCFDENEIAYIAMYIASIYESSIKEKTLLNVLLICSFGLATSSILKTRILSFLPDCNIIGPMSLAEALEYLKVNNVDMVISTNELYIENIPIIAVNPLLSNSDIEKIRSRLYQYSYAKMCQQFIKNSSENFTNTRSIKKISDYILPEDITVKDRCSSWEEAIKDAANPLIKKRLIRQSYVEAMINAVNEFGTYMVLTPFTAYVHAGIDDGIEKNCVSLLVLRNPIEFGSRNSKVIRNVVVLGIKNKSNNELLNIAYILEKERNIEKLSSQDIDVKQILELHD